MRNLGPQSVWLSDFLNICVVYIPVALEMEPQKIMDLEAIAAIIRAACDVAAFLRLQREDDQRTLTPDDVEKPPEIAISDTEFAALTTALYNSYDSAELQAIYNRLAECRQRFMETLDGQERQRCICNVLRRVAQGNNDSLPDIDGWNETFRQLCLPRDSPLAR